MSDEIRLRRETEYLDVCHGAWEIQYGSTRVRVPGLRNWWCAVWQFDGLPPKPKLQNIEKAIRKAVRIHDLDHEAHEDPIVQHASLVEQIKRTL